MVEGLHCKPFPKLRKMLTVERPGRHLTELPNGKSPLSNAFNCSWRVLPCSFSEQPLYRCLFTDKRLFVLGENTPTAKISATVGFHVIPRDIPLSQLSAIMPGPPTGTSSTDLAVRLKSVRTALYYAKSQKDDDGMNEQFPFVWVAVYNVLELDPELRRPLATQSQFLKNVNRLGVERFCNLVRNAKEENGTWKELLQDGEIPPSPTIALIMTSP